MAIVVETLKTTKVIVMLVEKSKAFAFVLC